MKRTFATLIAVMICVTATAVEWTPVKGHIMTPFAENVTPATVHQEYPRPQMVRDQWINLNGLWDYALEPLRKDEFRLDENVISAVHKTGSNNTKYIDIGIIEWQDPQSKSRPSIVVR